MKVQADVATLPVHDGTLSQASRKICMHVLGSARTDVRVMREANALTGAGYAVFIVDVEGACNQPVAEHISGICVQHIIMPRSFVSTRFKRWTLLRAVQLLIRSILCLIQTPADVYHAHDVSALPACYIASRLRRKPLIFDAHELPLAEMSINWRWFRAGMKWLLTRLVPACAGIITVSPPIAEEITRNYPGAEVVLVRNIPAHQVIAKRDRLRQYLGLGADVRIALYQGVLQSNRGLDTLIQAAKYIEQDIVIVLMGPTSDAVQLHLRELAIKEGAAAQIRILPPVPYEDLLNWTASADIGLIIYQPDYSQNVRMCLPNKLFEYLMAGLPVLASSLDAVTDLIKNYDVGHVIVSLTPACIGEAINVMLADPVALARMRKQALEASKHDLCWEQERRQLFQLYHTVLARSNDDIAH